MSVFVNRPALSWRSGSVSQLTADHEGELHDFAQELGLGRRWCQSERGGRLHYNLPANLHRQALELGARRAS